MITDEDLGEIVAELIAERADTRSSSGPVLAEVSRRVAVGQPTARPHRRLVVGLSAAAVVAVVAVPMVANHLHDRDGVNPGSVEVAAAAHGTHHQGEDQLTKTCLDMTQVLASWGSTFTGAAGIAGGNNCSYEANTIVAVRPVSTSTVAAGSRTVYIAQAPAGLRTGFLALDAAQSASAARSSGQDLDPNRPYYLVVTIPADNPQAVLVAILQQFPLPG